VNFAWVPGTLPTAVGAGYGPIEVTVMLNGTAYTTFPAEYDSTTHVLSGGFSAPNNDTGAYWSLQLQWTQVDYATTTVTTYTLPSADAPTFALVSGSGALVVTISTSGLATIVTKCRKCCIYSSSQRTECEHYRTAWRHSDNYDNVRNDERIIDSNKRNGS